MKKKKDEEKEKEEKERRNQEEKKILEEEYEKYKKKTENSDSESEGKCKKCKKEFAKKRCKKKKKVSNSESESDCEEEEEEEEESKDLLIIPNKINEKCSLNEHKEIEAMFFCQECNIYMCNKCEKLHTGLFKTHHQYNLDKNNNQIFTGLCMRKNHSKKLEYFCKTHNQL